MDPLKFGAHHNVALVATAALAYVAMFLCVSATNTALLDIFVLVAGAPALLRFTATTRPAQAEWDGGNRRSRASSDANVPADANDATSGLTGGVT